MIGYLCKNMTFINMQRGKGNTVSAVKKDESAADLPVCSAVRKTFLRMKRDKAGIYSMLSFMYFRNIHTFSKINKIYNKK